MAILYTAYQYSSYVWFFFSPRPPPPKIPDGNWAEVESNVQHLTDKNFDKLITEQQNVLVMFYTSWCSHCKSAKPHYQEAANWLKDSKDAHMAALNCEDFEGNFKYFKK